MAAPSKQYGLIFPKKAQQKTLIKHSVFMDDSDDESSVGESLQREALKKQAMKQTKLEIQRALAEDSTVYEYDNIYDDIQQKKAETRASAIVEKGEKKPKYIQNILKAAELRKKEQEKRMEKKIQKEREMEGDAFDDKEAFVTSAYKKKLQERAEEEEREKREAALEACLDVTKQKDLSGFYRHLLNQAVGEEEVPESSLRGTRIKEENLSRDSCDSRHVSKGSDERSRPHIPLKREDNPDADSDLETDSSDDDENSSKVHVDRQAGAKKEAGQSPAECSEEDPKQNKHRRKSSSEERSHHSKVSGSHPKREEAGDRKEKGGQSKGNDHERKYRDHEKDGHPRSEDRYRKREEGDDRQGRKDRKERNDYDRGLRRERDRDDKSSEQEQQGKERLLNSKDRHRDRERDGGTKNKRTREDRDEKKREERKNRSSESLIKDGHPAKESEMSEEELSNPEKLPELKQKTEGDVTEQAEKALEGQSKFAKRSSEETVLSARDRYLARQMARVSTKSYIEKEED